MYRTGGLGDCFLLRLYPSRGAPCSILIDCGVFMGTPGGSQRMQEIAENICQETGGGLDVLVATHEHWDHLSGFYYAREIFKTLRVRQAWMGWTEKPGEPAAHALRQGRHAIRQAVRNSVNRLAAAQEPRSANLQELLAFNGPQDNGEGGVITDGFAFQEGQKIRASTGSILDFLRGLADEVCYLRPGGAPLTLEGLNGLRIYVLGPPTDPRLIGKSAPSAGQVYGLAAESFLSGAHAAASLGMEAGPLTEQLWGDPPDPLRRIPFDPETAIPIAASRDEPLLKHYLEEQDWRRIDGLEIDATELLALKLDEDTNNTSLVLAFELLESGNVLLFPGDAQVGSWLSWEALEWLDPTLSNRRIVTGDLLERTVLYKVGHHGSHNATARGQGLERMARPELTALLPVYEEQAHRKGWEMPARALYQKLLEKTSGRILRMDRGEGEALWLDVDLR
jgi:hypothetical protein